MVDWKKDLKLSDLLARKGDEPEFEATDPSYEQPSAPEGSDALTTHGEAEPADFETAREMSESGEGERSTPFWKRELGFRRQRGEAEPEDELETLDDEPEKRSFFKRELSFRRASDEEPTSDDELDLDGPEGESKPFWKRELSFGRRRDDDVDTSEEFDREPTSENGFEADAAEKTPFWKRELSFGRRKDDDAVEDFETDEDEQPEPAFVDEAFVDDGEKTPFWKRGRRKGELEGEAEEFEPQAQDEPFAEDAVEKTPFWKRDLGFGKRGSMEEAETEESEAEDLEREEPSTPFWKRELSFGRRKDDEDAEAVLEHEEPAHEEPEPVTAAVPEPVAIDKTPSSETFGSDEDATPDVTVEATEPEPIAHEPVAASAHSAPEPQFEAEPEPEPIAAFADPEPVAADPDPLEAEPTHEHDFANVAVEDDQELFGEHETEPTDAPFWKREIKFGRRRGDDRLQPPTEFAAPLDEVDTFADLADDDTERVPFWKRKLGRDEALSSDSELDDSHEPAKKSFFGLSLRREKDLDFEAPESEPTTPFWKRDFSFRRKDTGSQTSAARAGRSGRTKQLVGLKVGASQIAAARVMNNGSPELVQLARQSIEQGIVVGGELRDPDALAELLREFFSKNKLPNKNVRLGIGNNRIGVRSFEISGVHDPTQLENAIRFRAQEALPIPLDEAVLDYQVIDETVSPTGIRTYRVLLVVAYRELIDRYVAACRGAGLRLVGIDLEAFALLRAMAPPPAEGLPEDTALVAVAIGHDRSTFAVSSGAVCEFTRVLDWGGSSLNTAIARALDITPSQAEPVKRTLSLSDGESGDVTPTNEHTIRAEEAVRLELQTFARELVSSLHFYQNQPGSLAIGAITLTGGTAHLPGLAAELQRLIGVKVRVGDPLRRVKTAKRVETPAQVGSMAVAIGLGIED